MKIGELFTATNVDTRQCAHCPAPVAEVDGRCMHFEVGENGAKTTWNDCYTVVRGRRKYIGTTAA